MEPSATIFRKAPTTLLQMLTGNRFTIPDYQRAYSWETEAESSKPPKHTNVFLGDLEAYVRSNGASPYYYGHFILEELGDNKYGVIDGQQRLTTLIIFLAALFARLKTLRKLSPEEKEQFSNLISAPGSQRFETVTYDRQLFNDVILDRRKISGDEVDTISARRIIEASDYFVRTLAEKDEQYLTTLLETVCGTRCTIHLVAEESEAIQMFIFQNNRGKVPTSLEIIKAEFMFAIHLYGGVHKEGLISEIKNRFERIYHAISSIEDRVREDDVLLYTLQIYKGSLWEGGALGKITKVLATDDPLPFVRDFTLFLENSFTHLRTFFVRDERDYIEVHSLVTLGGYALALPFVIKAYSFQTPKDELRSLCAHLELLTFRRRVIGTRAELISRVNDQFAGFTKENPSVQPILDRIHFLKTTTEWWYAHWNDVELAKALQGNINRPMVRFLLWKYENHLMAQGKKGYSPARFDRISAPHLEHIAPQTPAKGETLASGYCPYDEEFINQYIDCLGNYLLLSGPHNSSIGNKAFAIKRATYDRLEQQREIQRMTSHSVFWSKPLIQMRKEKIIAFILDSL